MTTLPLTGRGVVTTRDRPGRLDSLLARAGADVIHIPLIEIVAPADGGAALRTGLDRLAEVDWVVVTSAHGADAVGAVAAEHRHLRLGAVGTRTAVRLVALTGREVDVVPDRQTAADLVAAMPDGGGRVLVAQADRADATLVDGLAGRGYEVEAVTAYRTVLRTPSPAEARAALGADAVAFASGSAVEAWAAAFGSATPPVVVAIGPTTAAAADRYGLKITRVAADHHVEGLADAVVAALS